MGTNYTRYGNETPNENGPQRVSYINNCGHGDSRVWGKDNRSKEDGDEFLSGYMLHMAHEGTPFCEHRTCETCVVHQYERARISECDLVSPTSTGLLIRTRSRTLFDLESYLVRRPGTLSRNF